MKNRLAKQERQEVKLKKLRQQLNQPQPKRGIYIAPPIDRRTLRKGETEEYICPIQGLGFGNNFQTDYGKFGTKKGYGQLSENADSKGSGGIKIGANEFAKIASQEPFPFFHFPSISEVYGRINERGNSWNSELEEVAKLENFSSGRGIRKFKEKPVYDEHGADIYRMSEKD